MSDPGSHETPRVALVTGAASGIGRAVVARLVVGGMEVVGLDVSEVLDAAGGLRCDVTDEAAVSVAVDEVLRRHCRIDALVNVAGITTSGTPVEDLTLEEWHRVLAVNLTGTFLCTKHVVPAMRRQQAGAIVNVASSSAARPSQPGQAAYVASKGGVVALTRLLCLELAPSGITVNAVSPGPTRTPMVAGFGEDWARSKSTAIPAGRLAEPGDIADAVAYLVSPDARYVNGQVVAVDGGMTSVIMA